VSPAPMSDESFAVTIVLAIALVLYARRQ